MKQWQKDVKHHAMFDFLYRERRGGLIEKEKAFDRIEEEARTNATFFTRRYGKKHHWNAICPCCGQEREHSNHVLHSCRTTKAAHMANLRQEVIEELRKFIDDSETHFLEQLPAWFACADDTVTPSVHADERLRQIARYPKRLGSLAYVPTALVSWLRANTKKTKKGASDVNGALYAVQVLLIKRAQTIWNERCKLFHEQWNAECKRRKEGEEQRIQAAVRREIEDQAQRASLVQHPVLAPLPNAAAIEQQIRSLEQPLTLIDGTVLRRTFRIADPPCPR